jgi:cell division protein FtsB
MKNKKMKGGKIKMKILTGIVVSCLALLIMLGMLTSVSAAAYLKPNANPSLYRSVDYTTAKTAPSEKPTTENINTVKEGAVENTSSVKNITRKDVKRLKVSSLGRDLVCKGDMNFDNSINFADIDPFAMVLRYPWFFEQYHKAMFWRADMNDDGSVNQADVNVFVAVLSGTETPICIDATTAIIDTPIKRVPVTTAAAIENSWGCKGDINNDDSINAFDIDPFRLVLEYPAFMKRFHPDWFWRADINNDGKVNSEDVNPFVGLLVNQNSTTNICYN